MERFEQLLAQLGTTNSNTEKIAILQSFGDVKGFLWDILDPLQKTGITRAALIKYEQEKYPKFPDRHAEYPSDIHDLWKALVHRKLTGDDAKEAVWVACQQQPQHRELILRIMGKDLKTRLGIGLYEKAFSQEKKTTYRTALAEDFKKFENYFQQSLRQPSQGWFISRKLDGVRCQIHTTPPVTCRSREGRPFVSLVHVNERVQRNTEPGWVIDCEICVLNPDGSESFKDAVSTVKRREPMTRFCIYILDVLTAKEFETGTSQATFAERLERGRSVVNLLIKSSTPTQKLMWVEQIPYTEAAMAHWQHQVEKHGWEGLMLRRNVPYAGKRTKDILKVKKFFTEEYVIEDVKIGPFRVIDSHTGLEKEIETVTAVQIRHKGSPVFVGSGFTLEERMEMYKEPHKVRGLVIAVQYFEETPDGKSLRFPTFKAWYGRQRNM
jgi:DNA ligase 1